MERCVTAGGQGLRNTASAGLVIPQSIALLPPDHVLSSLGSTLQMRGGRREPNGEHCWLSKPEPTTEDKRDKTCPDPTLGIKVTVMAV